MGQTINIDLKYNSTAKSSEDFAGIFRDDFEYCMGRFKLPTKINGNNAEDRNFNYRFIVVSNSDMDNTDYVSSIKKNRDENVKTLLILLNPITNVSSQTFLQNYLSFSFWDQVVETGEIRYFRKDDKETQHLYWERLTDIVFEILADIDKTSVKKGSIYLAQTENSQVLDRDNIKRDLNDLGYAVTPSVTLSNDFDESTRQVNEALSSTSVVIHLIPANYTEYFPNKSISIVEHQCNLSAQLIKNNHKDIRRIIWIPSDFDVVDEKNQIFIEKIQRDQELSHNTLVLKVNLEDLKKIYRKILSGDDMVKGDLESLPDLYMIADKEDDSVASHINREASAAGLKFGINYNGISYNEHLKYLASAQVVVVNYTLENQQWINVKVHDILKSPGLETSKPNKKLVLIKNSKDLDTHHFEKYFNEVHVVEASDIKLNFQ